MSKTVENGSTVAVHYTGTLEDGTVFDSSREDGRTPLEFRVGEGNLIPGFEQGVVGMTIGDTKKIEIAPEQGYGQRDENLIFQAPMERLPEGIEVGTQLQVMTPQGPMFAQVMEISEDGKVATVDHNHMLAGKTITFDVEVVEIQ